MNIFSRFFGKTDAQDGAADGALVANPDIEDPLSLQVLFAEPCAAALTADRVAETARAYHRSMGKARCEFDTVLAGDGKVFGMIGWRKHVVRLVGFDAPMPSEAVELCIAPSHYSQEIKQRARSHAAHVLLYYAGYDESPLEQYVALAAVAGVLARLGAIVVLNESACTSLPAVVLDGRESKGDILELLRTLPLTMLYCGFVKHEVEGVDGVWMRTYGAPEMGLVNFAAHAAGHHEGQRYFDMFNTMLGYLQTSGAKLAAGHTMQITDEEYIRLRAPGAAEKFLEGRGPVLIVELIGADEINRH